MAPGVTIVPIKTSTDGKSNTGINARGIYAAVDEFGCDVINISTGSEKGSETRHNAIKYANSKGVIVVCSTGNDGSEVLHYPGAYEETIGVGFTTLFKTASTFSHHNESIFVTAPGSGVVSLGTMPFVVRISGGSSYAAPFVTGLAALLKEKYPDMTKDDFAEILKMSSEDLGESGYDTTYGWGFLRVPQAIAAADVYFGNADPSHLNGVVRNDLGWWLMKDGLVDLHANGIYQNPFGWWKASDGKITFDETGIFQNENGWWRVENSKVDFRANGIYQNPYGWWKTTNGKVTFHENGVFQNAFGWWYCRNSKVDFGFTGLASNKYGTWYIRNGKVDFTKNGKVKYNGKTYVVQNGKVK